MQLPVSGKKFIDSKKKKGKNQNSNKRSVVKIEKEKITMQKISLTKANKKCPFLSLKKKKERKKVKQNKKTVYRQKCSEQSNFYGSKKISFINFFL